MIPWQIYADYLEYRGFDTRLFRFIEPKMELDENYNHIIGAGWSDFDNGNGVSGGDNACYGDGFIGWGSGDGNGWGSKK